MVPVMSNEETALTPELTPEELIEKAGPFKYAKTMPQFPHEYIVRGKATLTDEEFTLFVRHIRTSGYKAKFGKASYVYLNVGEWKYWTMGWPPEQTTIINRDKVDGNYVGPGGMIAVPALFLLLGLVAVVGKTLATLALGI